MELGKGCGIWFAIVVFTCEPKAKLMPLWRNEMLIVVIVVAFVIGAESA